MDNDLDATLSRYNKLIEQLTVENVEELREFFSPNIHYRDPMMDAKGVDAALAYMHKLFTDLDGIQFEIKGCARHERQVFSHWLMTFRIKKIPKRLWEVDGVSKIVFDDAGKIEDQVDYWDASPMIESFPVLGKVATLIKKLMTK